MAKKFIVFDWNGTLLSDTRPSWRASNLCLEYFGKNPISLSHFRNTFTFPVIHFYTLNGCSVDEILAKKEESNVLFQSAYEDFAAKTRTRSGARALLEWIKSEGHHAIILSNYMTDKINAHLDRLGIAHYFGHVSAHDCDGTTILQSTTKADRLKNFMAKNGYNPADTYIVGDSMEEPDIARHLGLQSIGITEGYISEARLRKARPDHVVHSLGAIQKILCQ